MPELEGKLSETPLEEVLRGLYLRRASGILEIDQSGQKRRLYLRHGQLHLSGSHPLAKRLADHLARIRVASAHQAAAGGGSAAGVTTPELLSAWRELRTLVARIADVFAEWRDGGFRFDSNGSLLPEDLVGPLPTGYLVMVEASRGSSEAEQLAKIGGERAVLVTRDDPTVLGELP